jgi:hypothetical protein
VNEGSDRRRVPRNLEQPEKPEKPQDPQIGDWEKDGDIGRGDRNEIDQHIRMQNVPHPIPDGVLGITGVFGRGPNPQYVFGRENPNRSYFKDLEISAVGSRQLRNAIQADGQCIGDDQRNEENLECKAKTPGASSRLQNEMNAVTPAFVGRFGGAPRRSSPLSESSGLCASICVRLCKRPRFRTQPSDL